MTTLSPTGRDTSRGRLWNRMMTRGNKIHDPEGEQQEKGHVAHDNQRSVERWTLSQNNGDLIMSNQNDTIAKFEGAKLKSINGYRPPGLTASSGSSSLSSMSSEDAILQSLSQTSSWNSGVPHGEIKRTKYSPGKQSNQPVPSSAQKNSEPQQRSKQIIGTLTHNPLSDRKSLSVQTKQRHTPSMDPPMSALSHCSGFLSHDDKETGFPIKYRSVKSDEEKGFEIYLHEPTVDEQHSPYRIMSDMTPSPVTSPASAGSKVSKESNTSTPPRSTPPRYTSQQLKLRAKSGVQKQRIDRSLTLSPYGVDPILMNRSTSTNSRARDVLEHLDSDDKSPSSFHSRTAQQRRTTSPRMATRHSMESRKMLSQSAGSSRASSAREIIRE